MTAPPVLTVKKARPLLPQLIKRTVQHGEEFRMGARQKDEATLIASAVLTQYKKLAQIAQRLMEILPPEIVLRATGDTPGADEPWAGLKTAILAGRFAAPTATEPDALAVFRRHPVPVSDEAAEPLGITWSDMAARGNRGNRPDEPEELRRPFRSTKRGTRSAAGTPGTSGPASHGGAGTSRR